MPWILICNELLHFLKADIYQIKKSQSQKMVKTRQI